MSAHIDRDAAIPLTGASLALRRALIKEDVNLRRVTEQRFDGDILHVFHTKPYDTTTYMATVDLRTLPEITP